MTLDNVLQFGVTALNLDRAEKKLRTGSDGESRDFMSDAINGEFGINTVVPETSDSEVMKYAGPLASVNLDRAGTALSTDSDGIINEAKTRFPKKFVDNFWQVTPVKTGDKTHDDVVKQHVPIYNLHQTMESLGKGTTLEDASNFVVSTQKYIHDSVRDGLTATGATSKDAKLLASYVAASYISRPDSAYLRASDALGRGVDRIGKKLGGDDAKRDYAGRNLKALVSKGKAKNAALDLAKIAA